MKRALFSILAFTCQLPSVYGQAQLFQVSIDPQTTILSLSADQSMNHPGVEGNLQFFDSNWFVDTNNAAGGSVTFTAGPFINSNDGTYIRDCQLRLRRLRNQGAATWNYDRRARRTRYANGRMTTAVTMSSTSAGSAEVSVRVRFYTEANPAGALPAGDYVTTVVGTISAN